MTVARQFSFDFPSIYAIRPTVVPPKYRPHPIRHAIDKFVYHVLFAYIIDLILFCVGRERM